jgi:two-component system, OmpR family, sensor histidine kinase MprB
MGLGRVRVSPHVSVRRLVQPARLTPRPVRRRRLASLRTTFAVWFALVAVGVTVLVGLLSYGAAARLVRLDQQSVFNEVVGGLTAEVRARPMTPYDFSSSVSGHDVVRPSRTDVQVLGPDGAVQDPGRPGLPVTDGDRGVAAAPDAGRTVRHTDVKVGDDLYRIATVALGDGQGAVQVAHEFSDTEDLLRDLQKRTLTTVVAVVGAAGLFGWWLARRITRRLVLLTSAAEDVARTRQLDIPVPVTGADEVGRLGRAFDRMLGRLAQSEEDQRHLVQDAGHELRTPLTSLRTNISTLRRLDELPADARAELVDDLAEESRELTDLVNELVALAAGRSDTEPVCELGIAELAEAAAALGRRRTGRDIRVRATGDTTSWGRPTALQRAIANLVENAAKFDREGNEPIEIAASGIDAYRTGVPDVDGFDIAVSGTDVPGTGIPESGAGAPGAPGVRVAVLDRGPGLSEPDLARVFDRFYRTAAARSLPGSGLGLSIVREVAVAHGGTTFAAPREGGGLVIGFTVGHMADGSGRIGDGSPYAY